MGDEFSPGVVSTVGFVDSGDLGAEASARAAADAAHEADTTNIHGIADTADLARTGDAPAPHAASHADGGTDAVTAAGIQAVTAAHTVTVVTPDGYPVNVLAAGGVVAFAQTGDAHARLIVLADGTTRWGDGTFDPAPNGSTNADMFFDQSIASSGLATDGPFQAYGGLYDENGTHVVPNFASIVHLVAPDSTVYAVKVGNDGTLSTEVA